MRKQNDHTIFEGKIDAAVDQPKEAPEVGEQGLEVGHRFGPDRTSAAAHVIGVTELPIGPGRGRRILVLPAERTRQHRSEIKQVRLGLDKLGLPAGERRTWQEAAAPLTARPSRAWAGPSAMGFFRAGRC